MPVATLWDSVLLITLTWMPRQSPGGRTARSLRHRYPSPVCPRWWSRPYWPSPAPPRMSRSPSAGSKGPGMCHLPGWKRKKPEIDREGDNNGDGKWSEEGQRECSTEGNKRWKMYCRLSCLGHSEATHNIHLIAGNVHIGLQGAFDEEVKMKNKVAAKRLCNVTKNIKQVKGINRMSGTNSHTGLTLTHPIPWLLKPQHLLPAAAWQISIAALQIHKHTRTDALNEIMQ